MTEFFVPVSRTVTLPDSKRKLSLLRGIQEIPDVLANHLDANKYGIIPVDEMSDAQWASLALSKDAYMADRAAMMPAATPNDAEDEPSSLAPAVAQPHPISPAAAPKVVSAKVDPIAAAAAGVKATTAK